MIMLIFSRYLIYALAIELERQKMNNEKRRINEKFMIEIEREKEKINKKK